MRRSPRTSGCTAGRPSGSEGANEVKGTATGRRLGERRLGCRALGPACARVAQMDERQAAIISTRLRRAEGWGP